MHANKRLILLAAFLGLLAFTSVAAADWIRPMRFEPAQGYAPGSINGQNGWRKTGAYDANIATVANFPAARFYGFGRQALQISDALANGSFGDQTFSPGLTQSAGEGPGQEQFWMSFDIGTAKSTLQPGLHVSVSPDDGNGGRMSYLRFEDQANGVHVFFDDVTNPGPLPHESTFNETDIATLSRSGSHFIELQIVFRNGPGNDTVNVWVDGTKKITGTTWENYFRYDPEASGGGNLVPPTSHLIFPVRGTSSPGNLGYGFLIDGVTLSSND